MERVREIQGALQLRVLEAAVSLRQLQHFQGNPGAVDMCKIAKPKNSMKSIHLPNDTQASKQLHAVVIAESI
ncbi:hypothetical protein AC630_31200 [Bradyrhizobium sp. AS23.2]|nr:hypothetical protein AC630_31200 [Bradyrhizobium sp. AS23.2]